MENTAVFPVPDCGGRREGSDRIGSNDDDVRHDDVTATFDATATQQRVGTTGE